MNRFIGIDPGSLGGIAVLSDIEPRFFALNSKVVTYQGIADFLLETQATGVVLEKVGANRNRSKGNVRQGASSMFMFGKNFGFLIGVLTALKLPYVEVAPIKWQAAFSLRGPKDEGTTAKKNRHKQRAQQLYPKIEKLPHWKADALLLATYCRQNYDKLF